MNFYKFANEVVDYATLKKKPVVFLDFSFHEKQITIKTNNIKKPHENDYWYQRNNEEDYKNEKYVVSGIKNTWFDSWDYIETRSFYGPDKKTIEYTLPGLSDDTQQILDEIKEYLKKNDLPVKTKYKAAYNGEMTETYFAEEHYCQKPFTSFVLYEILRVIEKKLGKEICFTYPRGFNENGGCENQVWSGDTLYHHNYGIEIKVRVFFSDFSDPKIIYDMFLEELKTLEVTKAAFDKNVEIKEFTTGKIKPWASKKSIEPSDEEKLKIAESVLNDILKNTSDEVISFLKEKDLLEEFKKSFINKYSKQSFAAISVSADIMFGDADGTHQDGFIITFDEFDYIKEWWDEYIKVHPIEESKDDNIFSVGSDESGLGAWTIEAINKLFEDKTVKVFDFDNGNSIVKMNIVKNNIPKFENEYENITDEPDLDNFYYSLDEMLLAYASYWRTMGKKPEYLIKLPTCF